MSLRDQSLNSSDNSSSVVSFSNKNKLCSFLGQVGLTFEQEEEAIKLCNDHLVCSVADLVLIHKRGELRDLFPALGLHARITAALDGYSIDVKPSPELWEKTKSPSVSQSDEDGVNQTERGRERPGLGIEEIEHVVRDWYGRTTGRIHRFAQENHCASCAADDDKEKKSIVFV
jgi:hypothetical protein